MKKWIFLLLGSSLILSCKKDLAPISGCTDKIAANYNSNASLDDGSCCYITGCTNPSSSNYNSLACYDDGSCNIFNPTPFIINTPEGFPDMNMPTNNTTTIEGVYLGNKLFHDVRLSKDNSQSCASCHLITSAFSDPRQFSIGIDGLPGKRNASTLTNVGWNNKLNWDGSALTLEEQAFEPITNPLEMNNTWSNVENILNQDDEYQELFKKAFNIDYIDSTHVVMAIAQFERTLVSSNSRYDQYIRGEIQLSPSELNGFAIFNTETGDCFHCHGSALFMDNLFHNNGLDLEPFIDLGDGSGRFKTPTLRNIEFSAPYMHDGRFSTLEEVVEHYSSGVLQSSTLDPLMKKISTGGLQLTNQQKQDLVAFLKTLTDNDFINNENP